MRSEVRVFPGPPFEDGGIAQLARAPALQAGGQEFESLYLHQNFRWKAVELEESFDDWR